MGLFFKNCASNGFNISSIDGIQAALNDRYTKSQIDNLLINLISRGETDQLINALIGAVRAALNTLAELALQLQNDAGAIAAIPVSLSEKAAKATVTVDLINATVASINQSISTISSTIENMLEI